MSNVYAYANGNPISLRDPLGLAPWSQSGLGGLGGNISWGEAQALSVEQLVASAYQTITAWGLSLELSTVNPITSGGGGAFGLNLEYTRDSGFHLYKYDTPESCSSAGFLPGISVTGNFAMGTGDWAGPFVNYQGAYDIFTGGYFNSADFSDGGYFGLSYGLAAGPPGAAQTVTNYNYVFPQ